MFVSEKTHRGPLDENWLEEYSAACLVIIFSILQCFCQIVQSSHKPTMAYGIYS